MSSYDAWKTMPPDDRGFCPSCYGDSSEMYEEGSEFVCRCGWRGEDGDLLSFAEMAREGREEMRLWAAGL